MAKKRGRKLTAVERVKKPRRDVTVAWFGALLVLAGLLAYSNSFNGVFVADDEDAIVRNESIRSFATALNPPRDTTVAGRPVLNLSFALNYAVAGTGPWGYHAGNLAIHIAAGLTLFAGLRRTLASTGLAFAVALLWLLHPLQTSAVTYVVQRAESLMGLFFLLTMYAALRADDGGPRERAWTAVAIVACALGMGTKEVMVVAPVVVALWLWILRPEKPLLGGSRRRLLGGLACTWVVLGALVALAPRSASVGFRIGGWSPGQYLLTQAEVIVHYLRLALWPSPLVFMYSWAPVEPWWSAVPELLLVAGLAGVTGYLAARRQPLALAGAWFFLILAPSSSVLPIATEVAAEHRMYLPLAAVIALVVLGYQRLPIDPHRRPVAAAIAVAIAVLLGATTYARNQDYDSIEALMRDTVENSPSNLRARVIYGGHLLGLERYADAEAQLRVAVTLPERTPAEQGLSAAAHMYLGSSLAAQGKIDEAISHLQKTIQAAPQMGEAHAFLGNAYASKGQLREAAASFERALGLMPPIPALLERAAEVFNALAAEHARAGRADDARAAAARAQELSRRMRGGLP